MSKSGLFAHFASKEDLQIAMLDFAAERFGEKVVVPALATRRGLPRLKAAFGHWLDWAERAALPGGCLFYAAAAELDDRPGPVRDRLVELQNEWFAALRRIIGTAVEEGDLEPRLDVDQFVAEMWGILLNHRFAGRLMRDRLADQRARKSFERLIQRHRAGARSSSRSRQRA